MFHNKDRDEIDFDPLHPYALSTKKSIIVTFVIIFVILILSLLTTTYKHWIQFFPIIF